MADILGGVRVPVTGRQRGFAPDIEGVSFANRRASIEHKYGARLISARVHEAWLQAKAAVRGESDIPVVTLECTSMKDSGSNLRLLMMDAAQFADVIKWYEDRIGDLETQLQAVPSPSCSKCGGRIVIESWSCFVCGR